MTAMVMTACTGQQSDTASQNSDKEFNYVVDQFADLEILRYKVPGFESLSLRQKQLLYHLSEAALMGRDIFFDQNGRYNLAIRRTLEAIYTNYKGDREDPQFKALETYLKRVWFSSGIHHHYALDKFAPGFSPEFLMDCIHQIDTKKLPLRENQKVWKVGGLYSAAIEKIVDQLRQALPFAENDTQKAIIGKLIEYYQTGDLKTFDAYSILWVEDTASEVDFVNGFIETYGDPLGMKASWESTVNFTNKEATKRTKIISDNAQWFEDHSPVDKRFKKEKVKGVSAKVITVSMLGGDCYPATPIGINLPNADWIRRDHGSKSVTIENITEAYDKASQGNGFSEEFVWSDVERNGMRQYGFLTDNLHTDLHECLGHGSGKLLENTDPDALKAYSSTLEETRADLFGLYYLADPKLVELGLLPDGEAYKSEYYKYIMNGLMTQLVRIELGKNVEEAHMRNRQLIAKWAYEKGKKANVIELKKRDGKTYVVVNDYPRLRELFGTLLAEIQRIKSEGDYAAGKNLVEGYGVKVDPELHAEVLERYAKLNLAPYKGFVNPVMKEVKNSNGEVTDIVLDYTEGYTDQMLRYGRDYSFLPTYNN